MNSQPSGHGRPAGRGRPLSPAGLRGAFAQAGGGLAGTLLIVDDEIGNIEPLEVVLQENGYRVFTAANGQDAVERIKETAPELVILDFMMPVMNGAELGHWLRATQTSRNIPIVMSSGTSEAIVRRDFSDYDAFLRKPYKVDELLSVIHRLLAGSAARR